MAVTATPIYPQAVWSKTALLQNSTGAYTFAIGNTTTNLVTLAAGGANGSKVEAIRATSTDTTARDTIILISNGTNLFPLGVISVPANSGFTNALPAINIMSNPLFQGFSYDAMGNPFIFVPSGWTLYAGTLTAITAAKQVSVLATGEDF